MVNMVDVFVSTLRVAFPKVEWKPVFWPSVQAYSYMSPRMDSKFCASADVVHYGTQAKVCVSLSNVNPDKPEWLVGVDSHSEHWAFTVSNVHLLIQRLTLVLGILEQDVNNPRIYEESEQVESLSNLLPN